MMAIAFRRLRGGRSLAAAMIAPALLSGCAGAFGPEFKTAQKTAQEAAAPSSAPQIAFEGARVAKVESSPLETPLLTAAEREGVGSLGGAAGGSLPAEPLPTRQPAPALRPIEPVARPVYDSDAAGSGPAPAPAGRPETVVAADGAPARIGAVILDPAALAKAEEEKAALAQAALEQAALEAAQGEAEPGVGAGDEPPAAAGPDQLARSPSDQPPLGPEPGAREPRPDEARVAAGLAAARPPEGEASRKRAALELAAREAERRAQSARDLAALLGESPTGDSAPPASGPAAPEASPPRGASLLAAAAPPQGAAASKAPPARPATGARPGGFRDCAECPEMVALPAGRFTMGSPAGEAGRTGDEGPQRAVSVGRFAIGKYEITRAQWGACAAAGYCRSLGEGGGPSAPAAGVSWGDIVLGERRGLGFIAWLNAQVEGAPYRLPSEAEWEYAARGGSDTPYWTGQTIPPLAGHFSSGPGSPSGPQSVGGLAANPFGLHDMQGNVWEWTADCYVGDYAGAPADAAPRQDGDCAVAPVRGGAWNSPASELRAAMRRPERRDQRLGTLGFRVARTAP